MDIQEKEQKVKLGRCGLFEANGTAEVELNSGRCNPKMTMVKGIFGSGKFRLERVEEKSRDTSRSGNGWAYYKNLEYGLYYAYGLLSTGNDVVSAYVLYDSDGVKRLSESAALSWASKTFLADFAAFEHEKKAVEVAEERTNEVVNAIDEERAAFEDVTIDGISAHPEFDIVPRDEIKRSIRAGADTESLIQKYILPIRYVVTTPVFAKASTAEEVVKSAKDLLACREAKQKEAKAESENLGLPDLTGTPRQVVWAVQLRAGVAKKDPSLTALKTATTARYWIEKYGKVR